MNSKEGLVAAVALVVVAICMVVLTFQWT